MGREEIEQGGSISVTTASPLLFLITISKYLSFFFSKRIFIFLSFLDLELSVVGWVMLGFILRNSKGGKPTKHLIIVKSGKDQINNS